MKKGLRMSDGMSYLALNRCARQHSLNDTQKETLRRLVVILHRLRNNPTLIKLSMAQLQPDKTLLAAVVDYARSQSDLDNDLIAMILTIDQTDERQPEDHSCASHQTAGTRIGSHALSESTDAGVALVDDNYDGPEDPLRNDE